MLRRRKFHYTFDLPLVILMQSIDTCTLCI